MPNNSTEPIADPKLEVTCSNCLVSRDGYEEGNQILATEHRYSYVVLDHNYKHQMRFGTCPGSHKPGL